MTNQLVNPQSPLYGGPYGIQAYLIPPAFSDKVVFEGPWIPIAGIKAGSLEVAGTLGGGTLSLQLVGTNDPQVAAVNRYTITVGGTITNNDTLSVTVKNPNLAGGTEQVTITAVTADTTTTLAAKLAAAIVADANLAALGIGATSTAAVVTLTFPSVNPAEPSSSTGWTQPTTNFTEISATAVTGGATETLTVAADTGGTPLPASAIGSGANPIVGASFPGLIALSAPFPLFIKARLAAMSGTSPSVTAALNASV